MSEKRGYVDAHKHKDVFGTKPERDVNALEGRGWVYARPGDALQPLAFDVEGTDAGQAPSRLVRVVRSEGLLSGVSSE